MVAEWISSSTPGPAEGDAEQVAVVLVDDHAGAAGIAAYRPAPALPGRVDVDHADAVPGAFGLIGGEPDGPGGRVAEEHLRHGVVVGGDGWAPRARSMGARRRGPIASPGGAGEGDLRRVPCRVRSSHQGRHSLRRGFAR